MIFSQNLILAMDGLAFLFSTKNIHMSQIYPIRYFLVFTLTMVWPIGIMVLINQFIYKIFILFGQFHMTYLKCSNCIRCHHILLYQFHLDNAISLGSVRWPILITFSSTTFNLHLQIVQRFILVIAFACSCNELTTFTHQIGYHDNDSNALLPNHAPKAIECTR